MATTNESRMVLRNELTTLEKRAYSLKTKKARITAFEKVREVRRSLHNEYAELAEQYDGKEVIATVNWSRPDGDGYVTVEGIDRSIPFYSCNDVKAKSWYSEFACITYEKGQKIKAVLKTSVSSDGITFSLSKIRGGKIDHAEYKELCKNKNRAFFKYPKAKGVTGLFAA
jgi:hypothetical protein